MGHKKGDDMNEEEIQEDSGSLVARSLLGGTLMGLANLVPGISGGTMLLAAGVYPNFINAIAEITRFRFRSRSLIVLGCVVAAAMIGILLFAGGIKDLVINHRWIMYSLFIGLTLGGIPVVKKLAGDDIRKNFWLFSVVGFAAMALLALAQSQGLGQGTGANDGTLLMFLAGLAGASAMILPGLSGGYLLLVMGAYIPILSGIESIKDALKSTDVHAMMDPLLSVVIPVGIGVVIGVVGVSNVLKWALDKYAQSTLGILLGLLVGAVVGLWPFQHAVEPTVGMVIKGVALTQETLSTVDAEDLPTTFFTPDPLQVVSSIGIILLGVAITYGVSRFGASKDKNE
ncbi:MAG: hypothetical protein CL916_04970 [Deltaproteobacteria bacterium]|nr:hypothetical protein [Deltaproteobacteria bacterium]